MRSTDRKSALLLAGAMVAWAWNMGLRVAVPAVLPFIRDRYSLTTAEASSLPAALNLGYYLTSLQSGRLSRRLGHSRALVGYVSGAAVLSILFGLTDEKTSLYVLAASMGVMMSLHIPSAIPLISERFRSSKLGLVIAVHEVAAPLGQVLGPVALSSLMIHAGYSESFAGWSVLAFASVAFLAISGLSDGLKGSERSRGAKIDRRTEVALMLLTVGALTGNFGIVAILPLHMVDTFGLEKGFVASLIGLSRTLSVFGQLVGGVLFDRFGFRRTAAFLTALNVCTIAYLAVGSYGFLYVSVMVVSTVATAMFFPAMYAYVASALGTDSGPLLGRMLGVAGLVGATLMPAIAGSVAEVHGYTAALSVPTAIVASSVIAFLLSEFPPSARPPLRT